MLIDTKQLGFKTFLFFFWFFAGPFCLFLISILNKLALIITGFLTLFLLYCFDYLYKSN